MFFSKNPDDSQVPEADSLPDGFVESSSGDQQGPEAAKPGEDPDKKTMVEGRDSRTTSSEVTSSQGAEVKNMVSSESNKKEEASEGKCKSSGTFSETDILKFTLQYQQILSERDSVVAVQDKLQLLCKELLRQNKVLMDECRRYKSQDECRRLSNKSQDAIKEVSYKLDEQEDGCLSLLKEIDMLNTKLKILADQHTLSEQQHAQMLKQKSFELEIADLRLKMNEQKLVQEQSQKKLYAEQNSQLLATEKNLRSQLKAAGEKFQKFQDALSKGNEVFESYKIKNEQTAESCERLKKENTSLIDKCDKTDISFLELCEKYKGLEKELEITRNKKQKLEGLCRSLQAERKASFAASSDKVAV